MFRAALSLLAVVTVTASMQSRALQCGVAASSFHIVLAAKGTEDSATITENNGIDITGSCAAPCTKTADGCTCDNINLKSASSANSPTKTGGSTTFDPHLTGNEVAFSRTGASDVILGEAFDRGVGGSVSVAGKKCFSADFNTANTNMAAQGKPGIPYVSPYAGGGPVTGSGKALVVWDKKTNTYSMSSTIDQLSIEPLTNQDIIGYHLHTGSATANGAVAVVFCSTAPLPTSHMVQNRVCPQTRTANIPNGLYFVASATNTFSTTVSGLSSGDAPSTQSLFNEALDACTSASCDVYFNFHTKYSFKANKGAGLGLGRAQLTPVDCGTGH